MTEKNLMPAPLIDDYTFGRIVVDGRSYSRDLIIYPDRVAAGWQREAGHALRPGDLADVMDARPEVLIIGKGMFGRMNVPDELLAALRGAGMKVITGPTGRACRTYNRLREAHRVIAALHISC
jgi:hypothetical protein